MVNQAKEQHWKSQETSLLTLGKMLLFYLSRFFQCSLELVGLKELEQYSYQHTGFSTVLICYTFKFAFHRDDKADYDS